MEDPAEDVFISTVWFEAEQYKVSTGLWEGGIYQAQIFLDFIEAGKNNEEIIFIRNRLRAILKASEELAKSIIASGISAQNGQKKKEPAQCDKIEASKIQLY